MEMETILSEIKCSNGRAWSRIDHLDSEINALGKRLRSVAEEEAQQSEARLAHALHTASHPSSRRHVLRTIGARSSRTTVPCDAYIAQSHATLLASQDKNLSLFAFMRGACEPPLLASRHRTTAPCNTVQGIRTCVCEKEGSQSFPNRMKKDGTRSQSTKHNSRRKRSRRMRTTAWKRSAEISGAQETSKLAK